MKRINIYFVALVAFALAFLLPDTSLQAQQLHGNGNLQTQEREVSGFDRIDVSGGFVVELVQGNRESLRLEAEENLLGSIKTEVRNGVLHIYTKDGVNTSKGMKAFVTMRKLSGMDISGGVKIIGKSPFRMDALKLDMSGAAKITMEINAKELDADISGASRLELTGRADQVKMDLSGASKVEATGLEVKVLKAEASGASKMKVYAKESLEIDASGASAVYYKGSPRITAETSAGARVSRL